jgi:hypothetical protein
MQAGKKVPPKNGVHVKTEFRIGLPYKFEDKKLVG